VSTDNVCYLELGAEIAPKIIKTIGHEKTPSDLNDRKAFLITE
jgi:hypothetical protein